MLELTAFSGVEEISRLFSYHLEMISDNNAISAAQIVGKNVTFGVKLADGTQTEVMPVFEMYKRHLKDYDTATVEEISGAPAELVRRLELAGRDAPLPYGPQWASDRQMVQEILRSRRRQQIVWEPLKGLAWAAAAVLLVFLLSWSIEILRPGSTGQPAGTGPIEPAFRAWSGEIEHALEGAALPPLGISTSAFEDWLYHNL